MGYKCNRPRKWVESRNRPHRAAEALPERRSMIVLELVLSATAIVVAAALCVNAVELLGERLNLGAGAVGSILAAVGTALPETMIPIVAVIASLLTGSDAAGDIGVGAILGAPFLLATLAMFVVGVSVLTFQRRRETDRSEAR